MDDDELIANLAGGDDTALRELWLVLAFLLAVALLYIQIAHVVIWGRPAALVGLVALVTICVVGFTAGALFPRRFTAPLVAVIAVVLHLVGTHAVNDPNMPNLHDLLSLGTNVPRGVSIALVAAGLAASGTVSGRSTGAGGVRRTRAHPPARPPKRASAGRRAARPRA